MKLHRSLNTRIFCKKYRDYFIYPYSNGKHITSNTEVVQQKHTYVLDEEDYKQYLIMLEMHFSDIVFININESSPLISFIQETLKHRSQS